MRGLAAITMLSLGGPLMGQLATPSAIPNTAPARPQPGIATGASGGVGTAASSRTSSVNGGGVTVTGQPTFAPPPVYMTPDQLRPPYIDPLWLIPELYSEPYVQVPQEPVVGRGRPGGLGVTIT